MNFLNPKILADSCHIGESSPPDCEIEYKPFQRPDGALMCSVDIFRRRRKRRPTQQSKLSECSASRSSCPATILTHTMQNRQAKGLPMHSDNEVSEHSEESAGLRWKLSLRKGKHLLYCSPGGIKNPPPFPTEDGDAYFAVLSFTSFPACPVTPPTTALTVKR